MKSRDERKAEFERREVERKAKYRERMDGLRAKGAAQKEARATASEASGPVLYVPGLLGSVAAAVIPGLAIYQAAKSDKSAKAVRDAMTPEQQAAARQFPMGQGGA